MNNLNNIGLDAKKSEDLALKLNDLLANYSVFYQNTRGFHWNIKGDKFFELHIKFEELYNDITLKIDEVAERILTLGYAPKHNYSDYLKVSQIKEVNETTDGILGMNTLLNSLKIIITLQRNILTLAGDANDEGTNSLMSEYIATQEKLVWMYSSYLKK